MVLILKSCFKSPFKYVVKNKDFFQQSLSILIPKKELLSCNEEARHSMKRMNKEDYKGSPCPAPVRIFINFDKKLFVIWH